MIPIKGKGFLNPGSTVTGLFPATRCVCKHPVRQTFSGHQDHLPPVSYPKTPVPCTAVAPATGYLPSE